MRERLEERLLLVTDVWFPTRAEMRAWDEAVAPLYLKWTRGGGFEIGPRLETMPAARMAPTLRGRLVAEGTGRTRLQIRLAWPRLTLVLLIGLSVALLAWAAHIAAGLQAGTSHLGWVGAWVVTVGLIHGGAFVSWRWGRGQLLAEVPWLRQALSRSLVEGEDWG